MRSQQGHGLALVWDGFDEEIKSAITTAAESPWLYPFVLRQSSPRSRNWQFNCRLVIGSLR